MRCTEDHTSTTVTVAPASEATGDLSRGGVLRFERQGGAMAGNPAMAVEDGMLALHYADGASVYIKA